MSEIPPARLIGLSRGPVENDTPARRVSLAVCTLAERRTRQRCGAPAVTCLGAIEEANGEPVQLKLRCALTDIAQTLQDRAATKLGKLISLYC